jgi:outer membrane protein assembly factor BamE (lipoprotein component of BamABCDE complex)
MNHRLLRTFLLASSLGFLAGCQTVESRIKERPEVFAQADLATQEKITQGIIELGFTEDHVYLALGNPDQKRETRTENGRRTTWIYNTYYERYNGTVMAGYHRSVYYDPYVRAYRMYYRPVLADSYVREKEERIRIVFEDGKASFIEQTKDR